MRTRAAQIAIGIDAARKRHLLAVELVARETDNSWTTFLTGLKERGLQGVEYVVSDSHQALKRAIEKVLSTALWQRCAVHLPERVVVSTADPRIGGGDPCSVGDGQTLSQHVIERPKFDRYVSLETRRALANALIPSQFVQIQNKVMGCRDPADDKFLERAVEGFAYTLITRDKERLTVVAIQVVPICTPQHTLLSLDE